MIAIGGLTAACGGGKPTTVTPQVRDGSAALPGRGGAAAQAVDGPAPVTLAGDTPRTTAAGATFIAPADWTISTHGAITILTPQEGDSAVAIVDATAADPDAAVAETWALYRSAPAPKLRLISDCGATDGWDQCRQYDYEIPPNEKRRAAVYALRHATAWTVLLSDASRATLDKRRSQFTIALDSPRPPGYSMESFAGKTANTLDAARLAKLDELVELGRKELGIPGVAVAIVQDGKVVHARGYGVREVGKRAKVTPNTLFLIASNTKALTTLLLAELVDDGKLAWDEPVTDAYPDFKLGDAATTAAARIEHLVCACTGLPRQDYEWLFEFEHATPLTELATLARVQPTTKFGETFQYSNLLAAAAGFVAAHVIAPKQELGKAYDAAMKARVFGPLGMKSTTFDFARALRGDHASPHDWDVGREPAVIDMGVNYSIYPLRPAGGAWSNVNDLVRYVQLELDLGVTARGKRIVSEANLLRRRAPNVAISETTTYGMGLTVDTKYGIPVVDHGGSMFGYQTDMIWLPDHGVGAVILTNADQGSVLLWPFRRYLLELLFDGTPEATNDLTSQAARYRASWTEVLGRTTLPPDPAAVAALATRYVNEALGSLVVTTKGYTTTFDFGEFSSSVGTIKNADGTITFTGVSPGVNGLVNLVAGTTADNKKSLTLRDAQHEYVFVESEPP